MDKIIYTPEGGWKKREEEIRELEEKIKNGTVTKAEMRKLDELKELQEKDKRWRDVDKPEIGSGPKPLPEDYRPGNYL